MNLADFTGNAKVIVIIDPRVKLALFMVTCAFVLGCTETIPCVCLGSLLAVLLYLSGKSGFAWKGYAVYMAGTLGLTLLAAQFRGMAGIAIMAFSVLIRMMLPVCMAFTLVFQTTTISQFMAAFQKMHLPIQIIIPVAVMFRFIPTVQEEWTSIRQAMAFRGIGLSMWSILKNPMTSLEHILIPLLFSAESIMDELAAASLARGLDSTRRRTCLAEVKMGYLDYVLLFCGLAFIVFLLIQNMGGKI